MKDLQNTEPEYPVIINKVGITNIPYPIMVLKKNGTHLNTISTVSMYVSLMPGQRGTHMSRFIELLEKYKLDINSSGLENLSNDMIKELVSEYAEVQFDFPYFITKKSPVMHIEAPFSFNAGFLWINDCESITHKIRVDVGVTSLCPCSKEISKYGAHNQRAYVKLVVEPKHGQFIWFEDLAQIIENSASSPIYPILKRPDEKFVTEYAYTHPMFMEDMVRKVYFLTMEKYKGRIKYIYVKAESEESIHQHLAMAQIEEKLYV